MAASSDICYLTALFLKNDDDDCQKDDDGGANINPRYPTTKVFTLIANKIKLMSVENNATKIIPKADFTATATEIYATPSLDSLRDIDPHVNEKNAKLELNKPAGPAYINPEDRIVYRKGKRPVSATAVSLAQTKRSATAATTTSEVANAAKFVVPTLVSTDVTKTETASEPSTSVQLDGATNQTFTSESFKKNASKTPKIKLSKLDMDSIESFYGLLLGSKGLVKPVKFKKSSVTTFVEKTTKTTSAVPESPESPELPESSELQESPELPESPEVSALREVPESPKSPEMPESPKSPEMPESPKSPEMPESPKSPEMPVSPKLPESTLYLADRNATATTHSAVSETAQVIVTDENTCNCLNNAHAVLMPVINTESIASISPSAISVIQTAAAMKDNFIPIQAWPRTVDINTMQYFTTTAVSQFTRVTQAHVRPTATLMPHPFFNKPCRHIEEVGHRQEGTATPTLVNEDYKSPSSIGISSITTDEEIDQSSSEMELYYSGDTDNVPTTKSRSADGESQQSLNNNEREPSLEDFMEYIDDPPTTTVKNLAANINCEDCNHATEEKDNLERHICQPYISRKCFNHKGPTYGCARCHSKFSSVLDLKVHIHLKHPALYLCNYCELASISKHHMILHKEEVHLSDIKSSISYSCLQEKLLQLHMEMHFKTHDCFICTSSHANDSELKMHLYENHRVVLSYGCGYCDFTCFEILHLTEHLLIHEEVSELKEYSNNISSGPFGEMLDWDEVHKCDVCDFTCVVKETLKMHTPVHKIFCVKCQHICEGKATMYKHKCRKTRIFNLLHTNESASKPFMCDDCYILGDTEEEMLQHVEEKKAAGEVNNDMWWEERVPEVDDNTDYDDITKYPTRNIISLITKINAWSKLMREKNKKHSKHSNKCTEENPCHYCSGEHIFGKPLKMFMK